MLAVRGGERGLVYFFIYYGFFLVGKVKEVRGEISVFFLFYFFGLVRLGWV